LISSVKWDILKVRDGRPGTAGEAGNEDEDA